MFEGKCPLGDLDFCMIFLKERKPRLLQVQIPTFVCCTCIMIVFSKSTRLM